MKITRVRRACDRTDEFPQRLRHEPGLQAHLRLTHIAFELGAGNQGGHRIDHNHIQRTASDQGVRDFERLFTVVGLRDQHLVNFHPKFAGIAHVQGVFRVNIGAGAISFLRLSNDVQSERSFPR